MSCTLVGRAGQMYSRKCQLKPRWVRVSGKISEGCRTKPPRKIKENVSTPKDGEFYLPNYPDWDVKSEVQSDVYRWPSKDRDRPPKWKSHQEMGPIWTQPSHTHKRHASMQSGGEGVNDWAAKPPTIGTDSSPPIQLLDVKDAGEMAPQNDAALPGAKAWRWCIAWDPP